MRSSLRRHTLVVALILGTAGLRAVPVAEARTPTLPDAGALVAGSGWQVHMATAPVDNGLVYRQWRLRDAAGDEAQLFIGATARIQTVLRWSGELGYQGEGYVVIDRGDESLHLRDGRTVTVSRSRMQHLSDLLVLQSAVVTHGEVAAHGTQSAFRTVWDALWRSEPGPYYTVRVAATAGHEFNQSNPARDRLLAAVLYALLTRDRAPASAP